MESLSLTDLVREAKRGRIEAFEEIVRRMSRRAVATAHLVAGDLHAGEEAAQDAFVIAWRKIGQVRDPRAFRGWFATILSREAGRRRRRPSPPLPADLPAPPGPEESGLPREVNALKSKYRDVLALRYVEGLSYDEIARALGLTVARVKSRLHDGREKLRDRLGDRLTRRRERS
ncbi:MAG: sigma-70 family RNA polymerase sigma factor [Planctomycetota bacterium]